MACYSQEKKRQKKVVIVNSHSISKLLHAQPAGLSHFSVSEIEPFKFTSIHLTNFSSFPVLSHDKCFRCAGELLYMTQGSNKKNKLDTEIFSDKIHCHSKLLHNTVGPVLIVRI